MVKRDSNFNPIGQRRGLTRNSGKVADWATASPGIILRAIVEAALSGGAIRFGYSRDGGAYAVGIYGDGEPYTEFIQPSEDLDSVLENIVALYQAINDERREQRTSP